PFLHRLQQRRLRPRCRPVDLVCQHHVREDRSRPKPKIPHLLVEKRQPPDVRRQQIRRKLDPPKLPPDRPPHPPRPPPPHPPLPTPPPTPPQQHPTHPPPPHPPPPQHPPPRFHPPPPLKRRHPRRSLHPSQSLAAQFLRTSTVIVSAANSVPKSPSPSKG